MLQELKAQCIDNPDHPRCDVLTIPHNSNLSGGSMFILPDNSPDGLAEAQIRNQLEPLVEITQIKGQSECRFNAKTGVAWTNPPDELCDFENMGFARLGAAASGYLTAGACRIPARFRRAAMCAIPWKTASSTRRRTGSIRSSSVLSAPSTITTARPGQSDARAVCEERCAWHSELCGLRARRSTSGSSSGSRPTRAAWRWRGQKRIRAMPSSPPSRTEKPMPPAAPVPSCASLAVSTFPSNLCRRGDFAERGYAHGVPMGGAGVSAETAMQGRAALCDPRDQRRRLAGSPRHHPATRPDHQRAGWTRPARRARRCTTSRAIRTTAPRSTCATCSRLGGNAFPQLCTVWTDPDFDADEHAFYYARILENPSCRWTQFYCNARGVDCSKSMGSCRGEDPAFNGRAATRTMSAAAASVRSPIVTRNSSIGSAAATSYR